MSFNTELESRIKSILSEMDSNKTECIKKGHQDVFWYYYIVTPESSYSDRVEGMCSHCMTCLKRPLNAYEKDIIKSYRASPLFLNNNSNNNPLELKIA